MVEERLPVSKTFFTRGAQTLRLHQPRTLLRTGRLRSHALLVKPVSRSHGRNPDDNLIIATAVAAKADGTVTGRPSHPPRASSGSRRPARAGKFSPGRESAALGKRRRAAGGLAHARELARQRIIASATIAVRSVTHACDLALVSLLA